MDKSLILNKIRDYYKFDSDANFSRFLGIKPQVLSNWKSRNVYDVELLYTKCLGINPDWLLTGRGEMLREGVEKEVKKSVSVEKNTDCEKKLSEKEQQINKLMEQLSESQKQVSKLLEQQNKQQETISKLVDKLK